MTTKVCSKCNQALDIADFRLAKKRGKYVFRARCRECDRPEQVSVTCEGCGKSYMKRADRLDSRWSGLCRPCATRVQVEITPIPKQTTHGMTSTRLYNIWAGMRKRCRKASHKSFATYGGRGIRVCESWASFEGFSAWAAISGYSDTLTLERVDVNGDYSPENCCWIPMSEQWKNRRTSVELGRGSKFTVQQILQAKQMIAAGAPMKSIAQTCDMSLGYVYHLRSGRAWKDLQVAT